MWFIPSSSTTSFKFTVDGGPRIGILVGFGPTRGSIDAVMVRVPGRPPVPAARHASGTVFLFRSPSLMEDGLQLTLEVVYSDVLPMIREHRWLGLGDFLRTKRDAPESAGLMPSPELSAAIEKISEVNAFQLRGRAARLGDLPSDPTPCERGRRFLALLDRDTHYEGVHSQRYAAKRIKDLLRKRRNARAWEGVTSFSGASDDEGLRDEGRCLGEFVRKLLASHFGVGAGVASDARREVLLRAMGHFANGDMEDSLVPPLGLPDSSNYLLFPESALWFRDLLGDEGGLDAGLFGDFAFACIESCEIFGERAYSGDRRIHLSYGYQHYSKTQSWKGERFERWVRRALDANVMRGGGDDGRLSELAHGLIGDPKPSS